MTLDSDHRDGETEVAPAASGTDQAASGAPVWLFIGCLVFGLVFGLFLVLALFALLMLSLIDYSVSGESVRHVVWGTLGIILGVSLVVVGLVVARRAAQRVARRR